MTTFNQSRFVAMLVAIFMAIAFNVPSADAADCRPCALKPTISACKQCVQKLNGNPGTLWCGQNQPVCTGQANATQPPKQSPSSGGLCGRLQARCAVKVGGTCDPVTGRWRYEGHGPSTTMVFNDCLSRGG